MESIIAHVNVHTTPASPSRPTGFEDRYRLYLDESGDHVFREVEAPEHRFLCLLGCWFRNPAYLEFHEALEAVKTRYLPHHPDEPVVLHREDMVNARKAFTVLRDPARRAAFDADLLQVIRAADFHVTAVVIDKAILRRKYGETAAHPYHLGLGFMLQRYVGYLNHINRMGDVLAEARGGTEDRLLKDSYGRIYNQGVWNRTSADALQSALTSGELKLKTKAANIAGLQLADLLGHPVKNWVLQQYGYVTSDLKPYGRRVMEIMPAKFNRQMYNNKVEGYGYVLYPK